MMLLVVFSSTSGTPRPVDSSRTSIVKYRCGSAANVGVCPKRSRRHRDHREHRGLRDGSEIYFFSLGVLCDLCGCISNSMMKTALAREQRGARGCEQHHT